MSLKESVEQLSALLDERPALERRSSLAAAVTKLRKALDDFLVKAEPEIYKDTREYAELSALLAHPEHKETVTLEWLNRHATKTGRKISKATKKEKEAFAVAMVKTGHAPALVRELKESPKRRMQDALYTLARLKDEKAADEFKAMKPKQAEAFCQHNEIPVARSAKGTLDKKKTLPHVLEKLSELREYLKL